MTGGTGQLETRERLYVACVTTGKVIISKPKQKITKGVKLRRMKGVPCDGFPSYLNPSNARDQVLSKG